MNLHLQFKDYLLACGLDANKPVSMARLLAPFGIPLAPHDEDQFLLVGHVLDGLADEYHESEVIEPEMVIFMAEELGCEVTDC